MDRFDDDKLIAELRELRPTPSPEFTAKLDERAAAGFPRRSTPYTSPAALVADWWRDLSLRSRLIPVAGVALVAVVVATAVLATSGSGGGNGAAEDASLGMVSGKPAAGASEATESGGAEGAEIPAGPKGPGHPGNAPHSESSSEMTYEVEEAPSVEAAPAEGGAAVGAEAEESGGAGAPSENPKAEGVENRDIERSSYIVLGTKPGAVSAASAKVFDAVHAADGIVLRSSVQSGSKGATGATFALLIPSGKVNDALAQISAIAEVRERHDATNDITAPTVGASEELADSNASIEGLLKELGNAETEAERESVEARLREERHHHAAIHASLDHLHERAAMSEVTVRIVTGKGAGVTPGGNGSGSDGGWGVGDALHDAGHILTVAAGVVLIGLAILAPIALIALLIWTANRFRLRRLRERALG
jgi:hypothetical protein